MLKVFSQMILADGPILNLDFFRVVPRSYAQLLKLRVYSVYLCTKIKLYERCVP